MVWNLFPFKGDFYFWEKPKVAGHQVWTVGGWVTWVIWCFTKNLCIDMMHEQAHCRDEAANHQLPIAAAFWIIWIVSAEECSSLMQNLMWICCCAHSVILNAMATQYTCSLNSIYRPHWLVQWSQHCSCTHIPDHSPWLPGYIVFIILTMASLFSQTGLIIFSAQK